MSHVTRIEAFFLKPLSIFFVGIAALLFFKTSWLMGLWMTFSWLAVGAAGASLHPDLSAAELARGTLHRDSGNISALSQEEGFTIGKALIGTSFVCALSGLFLSRHYKLLWRPASAIGLASGLCALILPGVILAVGSCNLRRAQKPVSTGAEMPLDVLAIRWVLVYDGYDQAGLADLLTYWGMSVVRVTSAIEASQELLARKFDLLILDAWDGYLVNHIRAFAKHASRTLLLDCKVEHQAFLRSQGYELFLDKPVDPYKLLHQVRTILGDTIGPNVSDCPG